MYDRSKLFQIFLYLPSLISLSAMQNFPTSLLCMQVVRIRMACCPINLSHWNFADGIFTSNISSISFVTLLQIDFDIVSSMRDPPLSSFTMTRNFSACERVMVTSTSDLANKKFIRIVLLQRSNYIGYDANILTPKRTPCNLK